MVIFVFLIVDDDICVIVVKGEKMCNYLKYVYGFGIVNGGIDVINKSNYVIWKLGKEVV